MNKLALTILLIRHGRTRGNLEKRYIGCKTDEPLLVESEKELRILYDGNQNGKLLENVEFVLCSPMLRAVQTAEVLFPGKAIKKVDSFREIDFGTFEGKNYRELQGDDRYQKWIDSGGSLPFPEGEDRERFIKRNIESFRKEVHQIELQHMEKQSMTFALVAHGGTLMAILSELLRQDYFDFQVENGKGFILNLTVTEERIDEISYHRIFDGVSS